MSTRRRHKAAHHERWLVSYADFITLLFAFFVVLFASSQADKKKQTQVAKAMKTAFTEMGVFDDHQARVRIAAPAMSAKPAAATQTPEQLKASIDHLLAQQVRAGHIAQGSVTTRIAHEGLVISLHEAGFFRSGSAVVDRRAIALLAALADSLPDQPIRVEGHTDNIPIHTVQFATNWELSTARAAAIARFLIDHAGPHGERVAPASISAAGYAEFHPVASNETSDGRTQNRRVDVIVLTGEAF